MRNVYASMKDLKKEGMFVPFVADHKGGFPDIDRLFKIIDVYSEFYCTNGIKFSYNILIGLEESKVLFYLHPARTY
jgi:hypothetical protein